MWNKKKSVSETCRMRYCGNRVLYERHFQRIIKVSWVSTGLRETNTGFQHWIATTTKCWSNGKIAHYSLCSAIHKDSMNRTHFFSRIFIITPNGVEWFSHYSNTFVCRIEFEVSSRVQKLAIHKVMGYDGGFRRLKQIYWNTNGKIANF